MPVAVVFAGWMMGGGQIAWQMQNDEKAVNAQTSISLCLLVGEGTIEQLVV